MATISEQTDKVFGQLVGSSSKLLRLVHGFSKLVRDDPDFVRKTMNNMEVPEPLRRFLRAQLAELHPLAPSTEPKKARNKVETAVVATKPRTTRRQAQQDAVPTTPSQPNAVLPPPAPVAVPSNGKGKAKRKAKQPPRDTYGVYWLANLVLSKQFGNGHQPEANLLDALTAVYPDGWQEVKIARGGQGSVQTTLGKDLPHFYKQLKEAVARLKLASAGEELHGKKPGKQVLNLVAVTQFATRAAEMEQTVTSWGSSLES